MDELLNPIHAGGRGGRQMATSPLWVFSLLKNYKG